MIYIRHSSSTPKTSITSLMLQRAYHSVLHFQIKSISSVSFKKTKRAAHTEQQQKLLLSTNEAGPFFQTQDRTKNLKLNFRLFAFRGFRAVLLHELHQSVHASVALKENGRLSPCLDEEHRRETTRKESNWHKQEPESSRINAHPFHSKFGTGASLAVPSILAITNFEFPDIFSANSV